MLASTYMCGYAPRDFYGHLREGRGSGPYSFNFQKKIGGEFFLRAISLGNVVPSLKIVKNLLLTYKKLHYKRKTISVQRLARSFAQTDTHHPLILVI